MGIEYYRILKQRTADVNFISSYNFEELSWWVIVYYRILKQGTADLNSNDIHIVTCRILYLYSDMSDSLLI